MFGFLFPGVGRVPMMPSLLDSLNGQMKQKALLNRFFWQFFWTFRNLSKTSRTRQSCTNVLLMSTVWSAEQQLVAPVPPYLPQVLCWVRTEGRDGDSRDGMNMLCFSLFQEVTGFKLKLWLSPKALQKGKVCLSLGFRTSAFKGQAILIAGKRCWVLGMLCVRKQTLSKAAAMCFCRCSCFPWALQSSVA